MRLFTEPIRMRTGVLILSLVAGIILLGALIVTGLSRVTAEDAAPVPESAFPIFNQTQEGSDELPESAERLFGTERMTVIPESTRLASEQDSVYYYIAETSQGHVCLIYAPENEFANMGCGHAERAVNEGVYLATGGADEPAHFMLALPDGFDQVVTSDGNPVGSVDNGLFTMTTDATSDWPAEVIVRGSVGEYTLELPYSGKAG